VAHRQGARGCGAARAMTPYYNINVKLAEVASARVHPTALASPLRRPTAEVNAGFSSLGHTAATCKIPYHGKTGVLLRKSTASGKSSRNPYIRHFCDKDVPGCWVQSQSDSTKSKSRPVNKAELVDAMSPRVARTRAR